MAQNFAASSGSGGTSTPVHYDYGSVSGAITVDWRNGDVQSLTLVGNATITHSNAVAAQRCILLICQDGTGGRLATWANTQFSSPLPVLTTTARRVDVFTLTFANPGYLPTAIGLNRPDVRYPFAPNQIPGLALWLDSSLGVTADGSNKVSAWVDQTGNAYNFTQSTAANQPLLVANQLNTLPAIRFDKTASTYLGLASLLNLANTTGFAWYFVMRFRGFSGTDYQTPMSAGITGTSSEPFWPLYSNDGTYSDISIGSNTTFSKFKSGSLPLDTTTFHTFKIAYNGLGVSTGTNFVIAQDTTAPTLTAAGGFAAGAGNSKIGCRQDAAQNINADLVAVYCYTQAVSSADDTNLRNYINLRFAI